MIRVHQGDRGPRVVLLQVLLNGKGAGLVVDGVFGPKTHAALSAYQKTMPKKPSDFGQANEGTWPDLLGDAGLSVVDALDIGQTGVLRAAAVTEGAGSRTVGTGPMSNGVQTVVQHVIQRAGAHRSIGLLRLWGHGNLGRWMTFSVGEIVKLAKESPVAGRAVEREWRSYLDLDHFDALAPVLRQWRPYFAPYASVEHHACTLANVAATRALMHKLADLWNVPVTAAHGKQFAPTDLAKAGRFQGRTYTAYPHHRNLSAWARSAGAGHLMCR